jgi:hypothetical protein
VCQQLSCKRAALLRELRARREAAAAALRVQVAEHHLQTTRRAGVDPESVSYARVPASEQRGVRLPRRRKLEFRKHLLNVIREAQSTPVDVPEEEQATAGQFVAEPNIVKAGCSSCRGHCCRLGATHAFLDAVTVHRYMAWNPRMKPAGILAAYLKKIPKTSVEHSCVYHGVRGCVLPRSMRAAICNTYHCDGLKDLQAKLLEAPHKPILIVAATDEKVVRSTIYRENSPA